MAAAAAAAVENLMMSLQVDQASDLPETDGGIAVPALMKGGGR